MQLTIIIPCYNESARIPGTLGKVLAYLDGQDYAAEVIVVDDGSTDGTAQVVSREYEGRVRLAAYTPNRGKGAAVQRGMAEARGSHRVYYDADASTPIEELEKLWPRFEAGADIVIGSRALPDSDIAIRQAWYRESMGRIFNVILRSLGLSRFKDTQCGFKGFTAAAAEALFQKQQVMGFSFDAEVLYIARKLGLRIDEVPVRWENCPHTRVDPIRHSAHMLADLIRIRWRAWRGIYG